MNQPLPANNMDEARDHLYWACNELAIALHKDDKPAWDRRAEILAFLSKTDLEEAPSNSGFECGWLVEHADSDQSMPRYFDGVGWTDSGDNAEALRFAREKDALLLADKLDWPNKHRVNHHMWDVALPASTSLKEEQREVKMTSTALTIVCPNCGKLAHEEDTEDEGPTLSESDEAIRKSARDAHFKLCEENTYKMLRSFEYLEIAQAVKAHLLQRWTAESLAEYIEDNYVFCDPEGKARLNKLGCNMFLSSKGIK